MSGSHPPDVEAALREMYAEQAADEHTYCPVCGARQWPLLGTDMLTCRRGHHVPDPRNAWRKAS